MIYSQNHLFNEFMRSAMRRLLTTTFAAAVAVTSMGALAPAHAAESAPAGRLMTQADAQQFGGVRKPTNVHWSITPYTTELPNVLCLDAANKDVTFPDSAGWRADAEVNSKQYAEVQEIVRDYGSADAAQAAWTALAAATASCASSTRETLTSGNPKEYYKVTQYVSNATDLVTTNERSVAVSADKRINGSSTVTYSSYRPSGTAIIQVIYYQNPGKKVPAALQNKVDDLSSALATRWAK